MASRALRRLQREQDERRRVAELERQEEGENEDEESSDDGILIHPSRQKSAFDLLNETEDEPEEELGPATTGKEDKPADEDESDKPDDQPQPSHSTKKKPKKKKKKKGKSTPSGGQNAKAAPSTTNAGEGPDEIDLALNALRLKEVASGSADGAQDGLPELQKFYRLLSIESKNLNALNEMKKLFGSAVLGSETDQSNARRRGRGPQNLDLGAALAGRHSPVSRGQGLAGLALRRNVFIQGKEEWPKATTGGLGMEIVEQAWDHTMEYKFVHGHGYRSTQREFEQVVETMDPQRMIFLLQYNPYHISTSLQVSEIAKQQGDHAVAADLLERALFSFGRSVHSTFPSALADGRARLDFRRPENREFWLAAWRYIGTLGQRGTWRTAYEWSKLLLSLDPEGDPYRQRMVIDQLAIRGGQFENFIALAETDSSVLEWGQRLPNIRISLALAHSRLKHPVESRKILTECVTSYPWVFARLLKELDIEHIPKSVWGSTPRTPLEELQTAAYVTRAKDLWNTPESISLLVEVVETAPAASPSPPDASEIDLNDARNILVSDIPALIGLLPRTFTNIQTSASDPLPPEDNLPSYSTTQPEQTAEDEDSLNSEADETTLMQEDAGPNGLRAWATRMMGRFGITGPEGAADGDLARATNTAADANGQAADDPVEGTAQATPRWPPGNANDPSEEQLIREEDEMLMRAIAMSQREMQAESATGAPEAVSPPLDPATPSEAADPQTEQRYLAGRGLQAVKEFVGAHGVDQTKWGFGLESEQAAPLAEYVRRATALQRQQRRFILDFALPQGAGREAGDLVRTLVEG